MMAPIEVPVTMSTGMCSRSSTFSTPTWASPRAPPPDSTSASLGRCAWSAAGVGTGPGDGLGGTV